MKKYRITLSEAQLQNLNVFLDSAVRARGLEAAQPALEIVRAAHEAEEIHEGYGEPKTVLAHKAEEIYGGNGQSEQIPGGIAGAFKAAEERLKANQP